MFQVAIQVRRTDKSRESQFKPIENYLKPVLEYYDIQDVVKRTLFVATDEPQVIEDIKSKYPDFKLEYDESVIKMVSQKSQRTTDSAIFSIITDVFKLASADFLVCTFSSNICRLAYELRLGLRPTISDQV